MADDPKPGIKTSEFGVAGVIGALTVWNDKLADLSTEQLWAVVILGAAYIISRALVKGRTVVYEADPDTKSLGEEIRRVRR
ncbi:MAG: hypothetical protein ACYS8I_15455 [Planctomycetota bacterium]|jgi:hypothetical protein